MFVVITHYAWNNSQRLMLLFPFWIDMAVPVFMIISGYLFSLSYRKSESPTLRMCYRGKGVIKRLLRFTVPFAIIFLFEQVVTLLFKNQPSGITEILKSFITGGIGPGSYYYPVLIQFVFIMPLIFLAIDRFDYVGLLGCIAANVVFEVLKTNLCISEGIYRLLIFRYITVIAFGCYFAIGKTALKVMYAIPMCIAGVAYIIVFLYLGVTPLIMKYWTGTSMVACLYIIPLSLRLLLCTKLHFRPLELLGKASYNIYLVQMAYYGFLQTSCT